MSSNIVVSTTITPEQATVMLAETAYEGQRKLRSGHVVFLAEEMRRGNFKPRTLLVVGRINGHQQLLDGQHRLNAVVASGLAQEFLISYEDYTEEEIKNAYIRIDQGLTRTAIDKYAVLGLHEELSLTFSQVNKLAGACRFISYRFCRKPSIAGNTRVHDDELLALMRQYANECRNYYADIHGISYNYKASERAATLALALITYKDTPNRDRTVTFWTGSVSGENLQVGDPRLLAFRHITQIGMHGGGASSSKTVSPMFSIRYLAKCYNSWMIGEERRSIILSSGGELAPLFVYGTPFDGKEKSKSPT